MSFSPMPALLNLLPLGITEEHFDKLFGINARELCSPCRKPCQLLMMVVRLSIDDRAVSVRPDYTGRYWRLTEGRVPSAPSSRHRTPIKAAMLPSNRHSGRVEAS